MAVMEILVKAIDQASDVIKRIGDQTQGLSGKVESTGKAFMTAGGSMTSTGMQLTMMSAPILAAGAGFGVLLKEGMSFERGMAEVFTLLPGISQTAMDGMIAETRNFSKEFGVLPEQTIPALYQALSAGVPPDNVFDFLAVGQQAALGGVTDLTTAVDGITSVVNAYGAEVIGAGEASDLMFTAVKLGKTTFDELSRSLFNVNPIASALGVEFGDVTAAMATMTAQGVPTSVATTQLRQMFVELSKEGGQAAKTFEEIAGKSFKEFIESGGNVADALALMEGHANETGIGINDLFGSVEAGSAALALSGENAASYIGNIDEMANAAGATEAAFDTMADTGQHAADKAAAAFTVMRGELADKFIPIFVDTLIPIFENSVMPALEKLFSFLATLAEGFGNLPGPIQGVILGLVGLLAVAGPILMTLGLMTQGAGMLMVGMSKIPGTIAFVGRGFRLLGGFTKLMIPGFLAAAKAAWVFTAALLANPITWIVIAIVALIAAIVLLVKNWDKVSAALIKAWEWIKEKAVEIWEGLKEFFANFWEGVGEFFAAAWQSITEVIVAAWEGIKEFFTGIWEWITGFFSEWGPAILAVIFPFIGLPLLIAQHWETIVAFFTQVWEAIKTIFTAALEAVVAFLLQRFENLKNNITKIWEAIKGFFATAWEAIKAIFTAALEAVVNFVMQRFNTLRDNITNIWNAIKDFILGLWDNIKTGVTQKATAVKDAVISTVDAAMKWIRDLPGKAIEWGRDIMRGLVDGIKNQASAVWNAIKGVVTDAIKGIKDILGMKSPSKVFTLIGQSIPQGTARGIRGGTKEVNQAIKNMVDLTAGIAKPGNSGAGGSQRGAGQQLIFNLKGLFEGANFYINGEADAVAMAREIFSLAENKSREMGVVF